jgi:cellulose synthase/poly-beta-1,6-N-acetylglucosamine synthase-like glycosyltransferase
MRSVFRLLIDAVFVFSVIFIWLMLLYQFVLTLGGFLYRRQIYRKKADGREPVDLPAVSVLIPARNEEKVIGGLLEKIGSLRYPADRLEVIVINDGSSDCTEALVLEAARRDKRIKVLSIPPEESGRGKGAALNRGLRLAVHPVIAVYDSDNRPEPDSLAELCGTLVGDKRLAAVTGKFRAYNKGKNLLTRFINIESVAFQWIIQAGRWFFLKIAFLPGTNFVIWKSVLEAVGGWDEEALTEDTELTFRVYQRGFLIKFLPSATSWEQEPERLSTWVRQRTRWARGMSYVIAKHGKSLFRKKLNLTSVELLNVLFLYYFFLFAILFSDLLFVLSLLKIVRLRMLGPYTQLWALAFLLFLLEILVSLSLEKEDSAAAVALSTLAYVTYTKLWIFVVLRAIFQESVLKKKRIWDKTERFDGQGSEPRSLPGEKKRK